MFENCAAKLKKCAPILFWIHTVFAFWIASRIFDDYNYRWLISIAIVVIVPFIAYINSLFLCAIGEIAEKASSNQPETPILENSTLNQ